MFRNTHLRIHAQILLLRHQASSSSTRSLTSVSIAEASPLGASKSNMLSSFSCLHDNEIPSCTSHHLALTRWNCAVHILLPGKLASSSMVTLFLVFRFTCNAAKIPFGSAISRVIKAQHSELLLVTLGQFASSKTQ